MNANEALLFIRRVKERIGRYPVLYTNHSSAELISLNFRNTDFANTPLWYARFIGKVNNFPNGIWGSYTLWQFSSEIKPQLAVPGTRSDMDINVFKGTTEKLKAEWPLTRVVP
jgi:GH25 family lysozyme M1 (1,4-beta-N-acetylmuramidase)